jgi:23S rRNA pseudouridine2605 synthase
LPIFAAPVERTAKSTTMSKKPFEKFIKPELKGAKKKEAIRQQKRKLKEESRLRGEEFRKKEAEKYQAVGTKYGNTPDQKKPKVEVRGRNSEIRSTKYEVRGTEDEASNFKSHTSNVKLEEMPLNKFIAHAGICGRREAAELVKEGKVTVNGDIIFEPGYKVMGNEDIKVNGKKIFSQKNLVYVLLNKPKDFLTTLKDPEGRKTVIDLVKAATKERIYPVGRLDRNTTGVLLLTNDGELAQKLTHPSFEVKKIYEVKLDKPVQKNDIEAILNGVTLEDGFINADAVSYVDPKDKSLVGVEIHSGRNRIVRRIFEHLGYDVRNLDRVMFANLTKKNVDRGKWRHLNEKEIRLLKFMNQSFVRAKKERSEKEDRDVAEVLKNDKPIKTAIKQKNPETSPARKRTYKETPQDHRAPRAKKNFSRSSDDNSGERKRSFGNKSEDKRPAPRKSFDKPRIEKGSDNKRPYKSSAPVKRSTDRRR